MYSPVRHGEKDLVVDLEALLPSPVMNNHLASETIGVLALLV